MAVAVAFLAALAFVVPARADEGDSAKVAVGALLIGQQVTLTLEVATAEGATVELDPAASSWNGVEVIRLGKSVTRPAGPGRVIHTIDLTVASFRPGAQAFLPAVTVVTGAEATQRTLPEVRWTVNGTLAPDAPLEISPLTPPGKLEGAESPFLKPAIGLGAVLALLLVSAAAVFLVGRLRGGTVPVAAPAQPVSTMDLGPAEELMESDPIAAYRSVAASVRVAIGEQYGFPATALTTSEVQRRMEDRGIDRWRARLVARLLEECDAVVYAGYRPAYERRYSDLTTAREIVEGRA